MKQVFNNGNLFGKPGVAEIDDMDQDIRLVQFFQSGLERLQKFCRQVPDKSNRVRNDDIDISWKPQTAAGRIERCKEFVFGNNMTLGQRVQECRLAGICIADKGKDRKVFLTPAPSSLVSLTAYRFQFFCKLCKPVADPSPVHLKTRLAGPSAANAAGQP